jgi:GNAT superfamily N-acetyltransferase
VKIIEYRPEYRQAFQDINYEWLTRYFEVEPYDRIVLTNPERHVIEQGGVVLFALEDNVPVGTCALMKHTEVKYELAKMGVTESARGKGIGRLLVGAAIERARQLGAETLILATSDVLDAANHLYKRLGFQPARLDILGPIPYKRHSIAMWMDLRDGE